MASFIKVRELLARVGRGIILRTEVSRNAKYLQAAKYDLRKEQRRKGGHYVEAFRYTKGFHQF